MKGISIVIALAAGVTSITSYAASAPAPMSISAQPAPTSQGGEWAPQYGVNVQPKTRAQVYQELVHAEQDGHLQRLDQKLYWHG